jgi:3D (Asp-Asp-Asp) domain-containing protein
MKKLNTKYISDIIRKSNYIEINSKAAEISFYLLLFIFPFLIFTISTIVYIPTFTLNKSILIMKNIIPESAFNIIISIINSAIENKSLGFFKLTAYCPCKSCSDNWGTQTSTGATATEGRTVAVDPKVIPYGTTLIINGIEYIAEDCGGSIKGNKIDIYFESHKKALEFGIQYTEIFVKEMN